MKLNGNFTIIPNEFINDSRLDVYEFRILCYLMKLSGCSSSCYPSYETIARETGMSLSKANNGIKNLIGYDKNYLPPRRRNSRRDLFDYQPKSGTVVAYDYAVRRKKKL